MDSTEWLVRSYTVVTVVAPGGSSVTRTYPQEPITISSPVSPFTLSTMRFFKQAWQRVAEQLYTSLPSPASSAPTSSNTQE